MAASPMRHTAVEDNGNTKNSTAGGREGMGGDEWEGNKGGREEWGGEGWTNDQSVDQNRKIEKQKLRTEERKAGRY